jgi:phosphate-selective porin OprO and OprP
MHSFCRKAALLLSASIPCLLAAPAMAADDAAIQRLESQMRALQAQIDQLKAQQAAPAPAAPVAAAPAPAAVLGANKPAIAYETPSHQFGLTSADGANSIELTGRVHFDTGFYPGYTAAEGVGPYGAGKKPQSGVNARRVRLGVVGKFLDDFNYALIYDFGGSTDATPTTTGIENAYITYNGFNKASTPVPVAIDFGYMDIPFTLDEAVSSNDIMFMERSSSQVAATTFGGSDARSALGFRSYKPNYFAGAWLTGPQAGDPHSGAQRSRLAFLVRASVNPIQTDAYSLHIGGGYAYSEPPKGNATVPTVTLSDRPEFRIDPTVTLSTGGIPEKNGSVAAAELAGTFGNFFLQGEYYHYTISQKERAPNPFGGTNLASPDLDFDGGYVQASYSIGGRRKYAPATGGYTGVVPDHPFSLSKGGMGAFELAARFSALDLNDHLPAQGAPFASTGGVQGGDQKAYTLGVNWYASTNVRVMFNWVHADINARTLTTSATRNEQGGSRIDSVGARAQFAF